jgi:hypothetical protein
VRLSPLSGTIGHYWPIVPPPDDGDECGAVGGMIGKGNLSTLKNPAQGRFVHHKSHMTCPGLEPGPTSLCYSFRMRDHQTGQC